MAEAATRTVDRALLLLSHICESGELSLSKAARAAELSPSTALRLLRTLEARGFLRRNEAGVYLPGFQLLQMGAQALSNDSLVALSAPALRHLVEATGESAYLVVPHLQGTEREHYIYIAMEEGTHSIRHSSWVGRSFPFRDSAAGAALSGHVAAGEYSVVCQAVEPDVTAIAAPVRGPGDDSGEAKIVAALSVLAPSYRISPERSQTIGRLVADQATRVFSSASQHPQAKESAS